MKRFHNAAKHRTECARIMRRFRNTVAPGSTFALPNNRDYWRQWCAAGYLGWTVRGGWPNDVTVTRPAARS